MKARAPAGMTVRLKIRRPGEPRKPKAGTPERNKNRLKNYPPFGGFSAPHTQFGHMSLSSTGCGYCNLNPIPSIFNSCARHCSYVDSSRPGPSWRWTSLAHPITRFERLSNFILRALRVLRGKFNEHLKKKMVLKALKSSQGRQKFSLNTCHPAALGKNVGKNAKARISKIFHHEGHEDHEGIIERIATLQLNPQTFQRLR